MLPPFYDEGRKGFVPNENTALAPLVLLVDDFDDNREMFAGYLSLAGFRVAEASTGREAVDRAFELLPDVILMDVSLPELDGWAATRLLKNDARTRDIPVIMLTGHALADHRDDARETGCAAFLAKPCAPDALERVIRSLLAAGGTRSGLT